MRAPDEAINIAKALVGEAYIYGFKHSYNPVAESRINTLASQYPSTFTSTYIAKAKKFIGKYAIDCSGLVCHCLGIADIGSYYISQLATSNPSNYTAYTPSSTAPKEGDILWRTGHCSIYIGDGYLIEAKGISYGVIKSKYVKSEWTRIIRPTYVIRPAYAYYENIGWNEDSVGWWYAYGGYNGNYYKSTVKEIEGKLYAFNADGYVIANPTITTDDKGAIKTIEGGIYK